MRDDRKDFLRFCDKISKLGKPGIHPHELKQFACTLINLNRLLQIWHEMQCCDRTDLLEGDTDQEGIEPLAAPFYDRAAKFSLEYLGLELGHQCDPRGIPLFLKVPAGKGDSFGSNEHLLIPLFDETFYL